MRTVYFVQILYTYYFNIVATGMQNGDEASLSNILLGRALALLVNTAHNS